MLILACQLQGPVSRDAMKDKLQFYSIGFDAKRKRDREITEDEEKCEVLPQTCCIDVAGACC